jgi:hypothetical protein
LKAEITAVLKAFLRERLALLLPHITVVKKVDLEVLIDICIFSTPGKGNVLWKSIVMVERKVGLKILTNLYIFRLPKHEEVLYVYILASGLLNRQAAAQ